MALFAFGVAGFVSMYTGAQITTALTRAFLAGAVMFLFGRLLAVAIYEGHVPTPSIDSLSPEKKEKK